MDRSSAATGTITSQTLQRQVVPVRSLLKSCCYSCACILGRTAVDCHPSLPAQRRELVVHADCQQALSTTTKKTHKVGHSFERPGSTGVIRANDDACALI